MIDFANNIYIIFIYFSDFILIFSNPQPYSIKYEGFSNMLASEQNQQTCSAVTDFIKHYTKIAIIKL